MDLTAGAGPNSLRGLFPAYPKRVELKRDRDEPVVDREAFIAKTRGAREFPWRVLVVAERDADLLSTDIVYRLASESALTDTSWIHPGKPAWDWWNANNVDGVGFRAGVNTDTYRHYIDFAVGARPRARDPRRGLVSPGQPARSTSELPRECSPHSWAAIRSSSAAPRNRRRAG